MGNGKRKPLFVFRLAFLAKPLGGSPFAISRGLQYEAPEA